MSRQRPAPPVWSLDGAAALSAASARRQLARGAKAANAAQLRIVRLPAEELPATPR